MYMSVQGLKKKSNDYNDSSLLFSHSFYNINGFRYCQESTVYETKLFNFGQLLVF